MLVRLLLPLANFHHLGWQEESAMILKVVAHTSAAAAATAEVTRSIRYRNSEMMMESLTL
ncbi:hypothetical protein A2U01_0081724, partial [Trifolium medium]|nr:hypothetical protein [Trifolium medium]